MLRLLRYTRPLIAVLLVALLAGAAIACPTCKDSIADSDPAQQALAKGFYYSILFMMSMPFTIVATFGGLAYLSIRKARLAAAASAAALPAADQQGTADS